MNRSVTSLAAACLAATTVFAAGGAQAATTHDYKFTFEAVTLSNETGTVMGIVRGLMEGANSIDTVEFISNTLGYGVGSYTHNNNVNGVLNWTVSGGSITSATFLSFGASNSAPEQTGATFTIFTSSDVVIGNLQDSATSVSVSPNQVVTFEKLAAVPLPLPAALLGAALMGLGLFGTRLRTA